MRSHVKTPLFQFALAAFLLTGSVAFAEKGKTAPPAESKKYGFTRPATCHIPSQKTTHVKTST